MRTKNRSPSAGGASQRGGGGPPVTDENLLKMRKSCERIAAVLGLKDGGRGVTSYAGRGASAEPVAPP